MDTKNDPFKQTPHIPQSQIYQFFAQCLQHFKNKMTYLLKLSRQKQSSTEQQNKQIINTLNKTSKEIYNDYQLIFPKIQQKHQQIFVRFISRVRELVHTFLLKASHQYLIDQLRRIQQQLKQIDKNRSKMANIITMILITVPSQQFLQNVILNSNERKIQYKKINTYTQSLSIKPNNKHNEETIKQNRNKALKQSYDKCLQKLNYELNLLNGLDIDETEFRRTFFIGMRQQSKKDSQLFNQIMQRNKYIKWVMNTYQNMFNQYLVKRTSPKRKRNRQSQSLNKNKYQDMSTTNQKDGKSFVKSGIKSQKQVSDEPYEKIKLQKLKKYNNKLIHQQQQKKRILTQKNIAEHSSSDIYKQIQDISRYSSITNQNNDESSLISPKKLAYNYQKIFEKVNAKTNLQTVFPLKKIQFKDKKLQLGPEKIKMSTNIKRRDILQRTQDKFRKKMAVSKGNQSNKSISQITIYSSANYISQKKHCNHLKTQYSHNSQQPTCPFYTPLNIVYSQSTTKYIPTKSPHQKNSPMKLIEQLRNYTNASKKISNIQEHKKVFEITSIHSLQKNSTNKAFHIQNLKTENMSKQKLYKFTQL